MARMSVEAKVPRSGMVGSAARMPAHSQSTDIARNTLMHTMCFPKCLVMPQPPSTMCCSMDGPISHPFSVSG